jgi:vacuolar-type H+-ATPase subunit C/Vma6
VGVDQMQACLTGKTIAPALAALAIEPNAALYLQQPAADTEFDLHKIYIQRLFTAISKKNTLSPLLTALCSEYEIRNVSLFLRQEAAVFARQGADTGTHAISYYAVPSRGKTLFSEEVFTLSRDTIMRMLSRSDYAPVVTRWNTDHDIVVLNADLEKLYCQRIEKSIQTIPGQDRKVIQKLFLRRLSLRNTLEALRMQRTYRIAKDTIPGLLYLPTPALRNEVNAALEKEHFGDIIEALPRWARANARDIAAKHPDLRSEIVDPELNTADLANLEKIAATLLLRIHHHAFHLYHHGYAPLYCYYHLLKREIHNIMLLVNGIRFGVDPDTFKAELVY